MSRMLSEEEARQVWRRAAELQARAADAASRGDLPVPAERSDGLSSPEVAAAAVEAGIGAEYVQLALAELETDVLGGGPDATVQKLGRRLIGEPFDGMEAARTIVAPPAEVHATLLRLATAPPYGLVLTDTKGSTPFVDDVLVFDVEAASMSQTPFQSRLNFGDVKRLHITLRHGPGPDTCRVHIRAPFTRRRLNLFVSGVFGAAGSVAGGGIGVAIGALIGMTGAGILAEAAAVGLAGAAVGFTGFRGLYRWSVRQAGQALDQLLGTLAADVRLRNAGPGQALPPRAGEARPGPGDGTEPWTS